jgi:hypothetical protein
MSPWKKQTGQDFSVSFSQTRWVNQEKTGYNPQTIRGVSSKWSDFKNHIMNWKIKENIVETWVFDKNKSTDKKLLMIIIHPISRRFKKGEMWGKRTERERDREIQQEHSNLKGPVGDRLKAPFFYPIEWWNCITAKGVVLVTTPRG